MAEGVIPNGETAKLSWLENMERKFPAIAPTCGFSAAETDEVLADCRMLRFVIVNAQKAKTFSKAASAYKRMIAGKLKPNAVISPPPQWTPLELPDVITLGGVLKRLQKAIARLKLSSNYSASIGEQLRIVSTKSAPFSPDSGKPKAKLFALTNSIIRIDWVKGKFHGVYIESQRGDETEWTRLDFDTRSPFIDVRPPLEAGKPEERRYRLRYIFNDEEVGFWSDVFSIITKP